METKFFEVKNSVGMRVVFSTIGASIFAIYINDRIMTLTPVEVSDFLRKNCYYGKNIGPIANRIKDGKMELNGKEIQFEINEGKNTLHSSSSSISDLEFEVDKNNLTNRYHLIRFSLKSNNLPGLRGSIIYHITYKLHLNKKVLELMYDAKPTSDSVLSLTNHSYFCLNSKEFIVISRVKCLHIFFIIKYPAFYTKIIQRKEKYSQIDISMLSHFLLTSYYFRYFLIEELLLTYENLL